MPEEVSNSPSPFPDAPHLTRNPPEASNTEMRFKYSSVMYTRPRLSTAPQEGLAAVSALYEDLRLLPIKKLQYLAHIVAEDAGDIAKAAEMGREALIELEGPDGTVEERQVSPGDSFTVIAGRKHRVSARTDIRYIEVSTPELDDVRRYEDDYGRSVDG